MQAKIKSFFIVLWQVKQCSTVFARNKLLEPLNFFEESTLFNWKYVLLRYVLS